MGSTKTVATGPKVKLRLCKTLIQLRPRTNYETLGHVAAQANYRGCLGGHLTPTYNLRNWVSRAKCKFPTSVPEFDTHAQPNPSSHPRRLFYKSASHPPATSM
ncbi:unnamed protein product [Schistocephalus solidus]|uniref:Uncharacterized protein n=1 Tax=Schistocephalus solidus TaxID=70667 RepID=A0A183SEW8_SCHSO|nr:unnamed protein product [Schistocephalus solidus]